MRGIRGGAFSVIIFKMKQSLCFSISPCTKPTVGVIFSTHSNFNQSANPYTVKEHLSRRFLGTERQSRISGG